MNGIGRLRNLAEARDEWILGGTIAEIADEIERERACDADAIENIRLIVGGVVDEMERHVSGVEGADDSPVARWARELREALGGEGHDHADEREAIAWVRDHGGLDIVKELLDWVVGHCSTKQQLDFDFWLSGRVMHELGFEEDMADREEVERRLLARLMPEGTEWPRYESGEPVRVGDVVSDVEVRSVVFRDGGILLSDCTSVPGWGTWRSYKEPIRRSAPKVLASDGEPLEVGQTVWWLNNPSCNLTVDRVDSSECVSVTDHFGDETQGLSGIPARELTHRAPALAADGRPLREGEHVYHVETGAELVVKELPKPGEHQAVVVFALPTSPASHLTSFDPDQLTHERPVADTWERLERDADVSTCTYFGATTKDCEICGHVSWECSYDKASDLVRRCRALAERERGE